MVAARIPILGEHPLPDDVEILAKGDVTNCPGDDEKRCPGDDDTKCPGDDDECWVKDLMDGPGDVIEWWSRLLMVRPGEAINDECDLIGDGEDESFDGWWREGYIRALGLFQWLRDMVSSATVNEIKSI